MALLPCFIVATATTAASVFFVSAGKGRAGLMTSLMLFRAGYFKTADEALDHYDATRVTDKKGLTVKSQRRFVKMVRVGSEYVYTASAAVSQVASQHRTFLLVPPPRSTRGYGENHSVLTATSAKCHPTREVW